MKNIVPELLDGEWRAKKRELETWLDRIQELPESQRREAERGWMKAEEAWRFNEVMPALRMLERAVEPDWPDDCDCGDCHVCGSWRDHEAECNQRSRAYFVGYAR